MSHPPTRSMNDLDELLDKLNELQDAAIEKSAEGRRESDIKKDQYYVGKDIGLAEAKRAVREWSSGDESTKDENY